MLTLREARQLRRMSQQTLADRAGVARVTVSQIELGKSSARPFVARKLSEALSMRAEDIVEFETVSRTMRGPRPTIFAMRSSEVSDSV